MIISSVQDFNLFIGHPDSSVTFELKDVVVDGINLSRSAIAVMGSTMTNVTFRGCTFDRLDLDYGVYTNVLFENCTFLYRFYLGSYDDIVNTIRFTSCLFDQPIRMCGYSTTKESIEISGCTFKDTVELRGDGFKLTSCKGTGAGAWVLGNITHSTFTQLDVGNLTVQEAKFVEFTSVRVRHLLKLLNSIEDSTLQNITARHLDMCDVRAADVNIWDCTFHVRSFTGAWLTIVDFANSYISEEELTDVTSRTGVNL